MNTHKQFTIREGLILVFFAGFAVASLSAGGIVASLFLILSMALVAAFAISVFVAPIELRTYSIGFVVPIFLYSLILVTFRSSEFDPYTGKLPTSKLLLPLFVATVKNEYVDQQGNVLKDFDPSKTPISGGGFGPPAISFRETPDRVAFMSIAHTVLALFAGYHGGKFASFIGKGRLTNANHGE